MGDINVTASSWKLVEVGRIVLFSAGKYAGRIAAIVEIIDHKRVLVDGASEGEGKNVPRHAAPVAHISLTPIVIEKLPRGAGNGAVKAAWEKQEIEKKWTDSPFAKSRANRDKRRKLSDFERFKVMRLKKHVTHSHKRSLAKVKAAA